MKKILFFIAILSAFISEAQIRQPQTLGSPMTDVYSKGTIGSDSGYVFRYNLPDTVNTGLIKNIPGIVIRVGNILYLRNQTVNAWIEIGTGVGVISDTANLLVKRWGDVGVSIFGINNDTLLLKNAANGVFTIARSLNDSSHTFDLDTASAGYKAGIEYWSAGGHGKTPGAVGVYNSSGAIDEDPATFFWNDVDNQLYIGQNTGDARLVISDGATLLTRLTNNTGTGPGAGGFIAVGSDDGSAMADLDRLGGILAFGRLNGSTLSGSTNAAAIEFIADANWTASSAPTKITFTVAPAGSLGRDLAMTIASNRNVGFGNSITDPTAIIHIRPPTSAAGTGQLKFETGTLPTTPETGLMNFKDGLWFIDSSTSIRDTIATREWARANIQGAGGGSGETNTASNLGGGLANYSTKVGVDLQFNSFLASHFNLVSNQIEVDTATLFPIIRSTIPAGGGSATFVGLTDGPGAFTGQALKIPRVNAGETALEYTTAGVGDVVKVGTPVNNYLGVWTGDGTIEGDIDLQFNGTQLGIQGVPGFPLDIWNGSIAIVAGGDALASTRTNATTKNFRMGSAHYTNAEEPVAVFHVANSSGTNQLFIGGGTGTMNAISDFAIYTTAGGTTLTGSEKLSITNTQMVINETGLNFDLRLEADADANMLTIDANALTGNVGAMGVGTAIGSVLAKLHVTSTLEQLRVGYDASNYFSTTVSSTGSPTFNAVGTSPEFNFSDNIRMASNLITAGDLTLVALSEDTSPDTMVTIEGGVINKTLIPTISGYTAVDSLMSGQYTPTLANVANVAGTTAVLVNYQKIGSMVHVQGVGSCTVTASGGTLTTMSITLPFASAMTLVTDCSGSGTARTSAAALPAYVATNTTTDVAEVSFYSGSGSHDVHFSFTYKVK